uniref:RRM domain-containing protein n=1 Tax=Ciona intestinalis TaxID=7719 RepID=F6Z145_CIOIN
MPFKGATEEEQLRKLFIGGISYETTDESMNDYFSKYGKIEDCVVIKDSSTGRSKGFGFVTFETEAEADACMDDRPHTLNSRQIDVKRAVSREIKESVKPGAHFQVKKIFIGGLKDGCDETNLKEYFGQFGTIETFELPLERDSEKPRGFAFITFEDHDTVDKLVAKRHHYVNGVRCEVKKALSKAEMEKFTGSRNGGGGGGYQKGSGGYGGRGYGGGGGGYGGGYGDDGYGYGGYDDYDDGYGYDSGYSNSASNFGPMKGGYSNRSSGPYGGGYGSGGGYGGGGGGGGYGSSGYGGYGGSGGGGYGGGGGGGYNSGYGGYGGKY